MSGKILDAKGWEVMAPYFTFDEFACPRSGRCEMNEQFMLALWQLRSICDFPWVIVPGGGFRSPDHYDGNSAHRLGLAVDIPCYGHQAHFLLTMALRATVDGFTGIGVSQKGPAHRRFIHLDRAKHSEHQPRPWVWSY